MDNQQFASPISFLSLLSRSDCGRSSRGTVLSAPAGSQIWILRSVPFALVAREQMIPTVFAHLSLHCVPVPLSCPPTPPSLVSVDGLRGSYEGLGG